MKLRATVTARSGQTRHAIGGIVEGVPVPLDRLPVPAALEISEENGSYYLFHLDGNGNSFADTWHLTLDEAKHQAELEFGIQTDQWSPKLS